METEDMLLQELSELIEDLGFDYDRMSTSGKETYEKICSVIAELTQ